MSRAYASVAVAMLALGGLASACGGTGNVTPVIDPPSAYSYCADVKKDTAPNEFAVCKAYLQGKKVGADRGRTEAADYIREETRGGYRLRKVTSLSLGGLAGLLCGTLLGAWLVARLKRKRAIPHGKHVFEQLVAEADAVRALSHGRPGEPVDAVVASAVQRLSLAVAEVERHGRALVDKCATLEKVRKDAVEDAHLGGLYQRLDELVVLVSRIRIRVSLWIEQRATPDQATVEAEVAQILEDLGDAEQELST